MEFMTTEQLEDAHRTIINGLAALDKAEPRLKKADLERAQNSRRILQRRLGYIEGDLDMARGRRARA